MGLYLHFSSSEEIDAEYNLRARMPDIDVVMARYQAMSAAARAELDCEIDLKFGPTLDETVDLFPASRPGSPVLLFVHGGYWRALSSREFSFVARGFTANGFTVAISNYSLCPAVSIAEITRQTRAVAAWLRHNVHAYNGDPERITALGHSAGAHQVGMLAITGWEENYGLPADCVKYGVGISGLYDLEPLRYSFLQPVLQLDHDLIRTQSPIRNIPRRGPPLMLYAGELETAEFRRQAADFSRSWRQAGLMADYRECAGQDHFSIVLDLAQPDSPLVRDIIGRCGQRD